MLLRHTVPVALLFAASMAAAQADSQNVDWSTYMGNWDGSKYKPLDQINASNFNNLEIVWRFKTDAHRQSSRIQARGHAARGRRRGLRHRRLATRSHRARCA